MHVIVFKLTYNKVLIKKLFFYSIYCMIRRKWSKMLAMAGTFWKKAGGERVKEGCDVFSQYTWCGLLSECSRSRFNLVNASMRGMQQHNYRSLCNIHLYTPVLSTHIHSPFCLALFLFLFRIQSQTCQPRSLNSFFCLFFCVCVLFFFWLYLLWVKKLETVEAWFCHRI